jgi:hypothetical protein
VVVGTVADMETQIIMIMQVLVAVVLLIFE